MTKEKKIVKVEDDSIAKKVKKKAVATSTSGRAKKAKVKITKKDASDKTEKLSVRKKIEMPDVGFRSKRVKRDDKIDLSGEKEVLDDSIELSDTREQYEALDLREITKPDSSETEKGGKINLKEDQKSEVLLENDNLNLKSVSIDDVSENKGAVASMISSFKKKSKKSDENDDDDEIIDSQVEIDSDDDSLLSLKQVSEDEDEDEDEGEGEDDGRYKRSVGIYRKMAYFFIFLVVVLILAVLYLTSIKVTITLIPTQERISSNMMFDVFGKPMSKLSENAMSGLVEELLVEHSSVFDASGVEVIGKDATGKAKIINNYNRNQPLVATTRLLTPDGVLFRIRETVNVPAGGEIEVEIYAGEPRADIFVGPTKFTIPGLWAGLQDQVYAETSEEITYKEQVKKHVTDIDISNSIKNIRLQLEEVVMRKVEQEYGDYSEIVYEIDKNSIESLVGASVGEEIDEFTAEMKVKVVVVAFDKMKAAEFAQHKFITNLPKHKELINFDNDKIEYVVDNYNKIDEVATLKAIFEGRVSLKGWEMVIDKKEILGLNKDQIEAYASSKDEISGVEVKFYPPFIKKIPRFIESGRIKVDIRK